MDNEIKNSEAYINQKVKKQHGFTTPKDYFDTFDDDLLMTIASESLPKATGFTAPSGYFDSIDDTIITKINDDKTTGHRNYKTKVIKLITIASAACIALIFTFKSLSTNVDENINFDAISDSDIEYWLENETVDTNTLAQVFDETDFTDSDYFLFNDLKQEGIEEYLNTLDTTTLLNDIY